jgi:hypothetical protein
VVEYDSSCFKVEVAGNGKWLYKQRGKWRYRSLEVHFTWVESADTEKLKYKIAVIE